MAKQENLYNKMLQAGFSKEAVDNLLHKLAVHSLTFKEALKQIGKDKQKPTTR